MEKLENKVQFEYEMSLIMFRINTFLPSAFLSDLECRLVLHPRYSPFAQTVFDCIKFV